MRTGLSARCLAPSVGKYYSMDGGIDVHNKMRRGDLALEKHWVTNDPYFRIFTTLIGICVTDAFNLLQYRIGNLQDPRKNWCLREFAGVLSHQCCTTTGRMWKFRLDDNADVWRGISPLGRRRMSAT